MQINHKRRFPDRVLALVLALTMLLPGIALRVEAYNLADFDSTNTIVGNGSTISGPREISNGGTYLVRGSFSFSTSSISADGGGIRVLTEDPVTLIFDNANFTGSGTGTYVSPLQIGTILNGEERLDVNPAGASNKTGFAAVPGARANVTIILAVDSVNTFRCTGTSSNSLARLAGIDVALGSRLTIQSETPTAGQSPGKLSAFGGHYAAGISTGTNKSCGVIIIDGGIIDARSFNSSGAAGISGGANTWNGGFSEGIIIRRTANVTATSYGQGVGIGGGGTAAGTGTSPNLTPLPGAVDRIHIFGGNETNPIKTATLGPTVTTHSQNGTDLSAGRQSPGGPKGEGDNIIITSGSVRAWDSDIVRSDTVFSDNTTLIMAQARNHTPGEVVIWPINAETFSKTPSIGDYNYVAWPMKNPDIPEQWVAYLWVPYAYEVTYLPGDAAGAVTSTNRMPIGYSYIIYNDKATVLDQGSFKWPGHRLLDWLNADTNVLYRPGDIFYVKDSVELVAQWQDVQLLITPAVQAAAPPATEMSTLPESQRLY